MAEMSKELNFIPRSQRGLMPSQNKPKIHLSMQLKLMEVVRKCHLVFGQTVSSSRAPFDLRLRLSV